jgi:protein TonB
MNIQRYAWSAVVAAGLHSALLISFPPTRIVRPPQDPGLVLPPIPKEEIQMEVPDPSEPTSAKATGGPALPILPEPPPRPLTDPLTAVIPVVETSRIAPPTISHLPDRIGPEGPIGDGPVGPGPFSRLQDLDRVPRATVQMSPDYPATMRQSGEAGSVTVEFDVDTAGRVVRAEAVRYTNRAFAEPAVRAVLKWRFEPGKRLGRVVPFRMAIPIEFGLDGRN